jgi:CxxC-x17-CxxC domain-containing protein
MTPTLANYLKKEGHPMSFVDKSIKCSDCGSDFTFSMSEQEFFAEKGYTNDPKRCRLCRANRMVQGNGSSAYSGYSQPRRQMFPAVCAECGKGTELPFEPRDGRPVYCRDCYSKIKPSAVRY